MKVVLALDSFKGSVEAPAACEAVAAGIWSVLPDVVIAERPMADGGEGTAAVMLSVDEGEWVRVRVVGALPDRHVDAGFAWFPKTRTALVEMAAASGLVLLDPGKRNPLRTTTFGTGELIAAAAAKGAERILLAVGGSATVDGGMGAAAALGWTALNAEGQAIAPCGGALSKIDRIVREHEIQLPPIDVLCDVTNPLLGEMGAAEVYGPQKGATPDQVEILSLGLNTFADAVERATSKDIRTLPGGGAAGGLAAGAYGLLGAQLTPGARTVRDALGIPAELQDADWVITGEGKFDSQSVQGKVVSAIAESGMEAGVRVGVIAGRVESDGIDLAAVGIDAVLASAPDGMPVEEAMAAGASLLEAAGARFAREHLGLR